MHGSYRRTFGPENVVELSKNIIVQHEDFLKQDDPDKKADALRYMAGYVAQYLHLVPQEKKFTFKQTERVLHNSAMNIADFDPREGHLSFRNLAKYAENLMEQPWRNDFHVIKLTSGFYVHNIAAQLQNAHEILIVLGYVNIDDTTLKLIPNQQNLANLKAVSRDCYVASQECLILSQIWQHVADLEPDYPLTIGEVFEYRKNHLGDTDTICNKLLYDIRQRMHQLKLQNSLQLQKQLQNNHHHLHNQTILKNSQRFVPVDRLIDYDSSPPPPPLPPAFPPDDEPDNLPPPLNQFKQNPPPPERDQHQLMISETQEQFKNVNLYNYNQDDEHIYDPVYGDPPPPPLQQSYNRRGENYQQNLTPNQQFLYNNSSRYNYSLGRKSSGPLQVHNNFGGGQSQGQNNILAMYGQSQSQADGGRGNSISPMIPKTVTSFFTNNATNSRNNVSKSNSMNSISGRSGAAGGGSGSTSSGSGSSGGPPPHFVDSSSSQLPLQLTKVKETDLDNPNPNYFGGGSGGSLRNSSRKSAPAPLSSSGGPSGAYFQGQSQSQGQIPMMMNMMMPDEYYPSPPIVKPVAVYGSQQQTQQQNNGQGQGLYLRARLNTSDHSEEVLNDAYAYRNEVSQISNNKGQIQQNYQHQSTPIPGPGPLSDSNSSELSSSREGSVLRQGPSRKSEGSGAKRPTHIDIRPGHNNNSSPGVTSCLRYADSCSSPETDLHSQRSKNSRGGGGYKELHHQSSSSPSPGSTTPAGVGGRSYPRNEELSSLDTVYYDYLLKQGQTDEIMGNSNKSDSPISGGGGGREGPLSPKRSSAAGSSGSGSGTFSRSKASQQYQQQIENFVKEEEEEPEERHIYDGRRVIPKKMKGQGQENNRRSSSRKVPSESSGPSGGSGGGGGSKFDQGYNDNRNFEENSAGKPSHDKDMITTTTRRSRQIRPKREPVESEVPPPSVEEVEAPKKVEPWDCRHCTFKNLKEERICEVCAKSKDFFEDEEVVGAAQSTSSSAGAGLKLYSIPIQVQSSFDKNGGGGAGGGGGGGDFSSSKASSGGTASTSSNSNAPEDEIECPQCTLLNPRKARICQACDFRLKQVESPKNLEELAYDIR